MLTVRCYPLADDDFHLRVLDEVARLGDAPQPQLLEHTLRSLWPGVRVVHIEPAGPYDDAMVYVFRDGHVGSGDVPTPAPSPARP